MLKRNFLLTIILFSGILFSEARIDYRSEGLKVNNDHADAIVQDFKTFGLNGDCVNDTSANRNLLTIKHNTRNTKSKQPQNQPKFNVKHRGIIDRYTQLSHSAIIESSVLFLGAFLHTKFLVSHLSLIKYSSWAGNSTKIRPPPVL
jgi:hypothetical protein